MSPLRFFIIIIILYIGWKMLYNSIRKKIEAEDKTDSPVVKDVLVEDPVCHTLIPEKQAVKLRVEGKTYYFCSNKCCSVFTDSKK